LSPSTELARITPSDSRNRAYLRGKKTKNTQNQEFLSRNQAFSAKKRHAGANFALKTAEKTVQTGEFQKKKKKKAKKRESPTSHVRLKR
jgi:hypothetical protein